MIRRLSSVIAMLDIDDAEMRLIVQWAAVIIIALAGLIVGAFALGMALRVFTCTGGIAC